MTSRDPNNEVWMEKLRMPIATATRTSSPPHALAAIASRLTAAAAPQLSGHPLAEAKLLGPNGPIR